MNSTFNLFLLSFLLVILSRVFIKNGLFLLILISISAIISLIAASLAVDIINNFQSIIINKKTTYILAYFIFFSAVIFLIPISPPPFITGVSVWLALEWTAYYEIKHPVELSQILSSKAWGLFIGSIIVSWIEHRKKKSKY